VRLVVIWVGVAPFPVVTLLAAIISAKFAILPVMFAEV